MEAWRLGGSRLFALVLWSREVREMGECHSCCPSALFEHKFSSSLFESCRAMASLVEQQHRPQQQHSRRQARGTDSSRMERRQCDDLARGTDAARMADLWTRGEHANLSDMAVSSLRASIVARNSYIGTSYGSIFRDKVLCSIMVDLCKHKPL